MLIIILVAIVAFVGATIYSYHKNSKQNRK